jgi:HicB-like protein involved in pilus formation
MSANKTTDAVKLNLRLPKSLHRKLQRDAKRNNVSLNTEIIHQLEGHDVSAVQRLEGPISEIVVRVLKAHIWVRGREVTPRDSGPTAPKEDE